MTKQEFIEKLKTMKEAAEVKKAEDTTPDVKVVEDVKHAEGMPDEVAPTQAEVEKLVDDAVAPVVPVDAEGISKNVGEVEVSQETIAAERKKEDNAAKDVINVTDRTYTEQVEVNNELVKKLAESEEALKVMQEKVAKVNAVAKEALVAQREKITEAFAQKLTSVLEKISEEGTKLEESLRAEADKATKSLALAENYGKASLKLNNILIKALKESAPAKKLVCHESYKAKVSGRKARF